MKTIWRYVLCLSCVLWLAACAQNPSTVIGNPGVSQPKKAENVFGEAIFGESTFE